jgi:type II secretory pathway component PulC
MLDPTDSDKDFYIISQQGVEALNWTYYLNLAIIYMIFVHIIFLIMKIISEYNVKWYFGKKWLFYLFIIK